MGAARGHDWSRAREAHTRHRVRRLSGHRYEPVGGCIYCGAREDLRDEHIVPFGLGGNLILPKSSCERCEVITSRFERSVLQGPMWPVRVVREMPSRRGHRYAPSHLPLRVRMVDTWETLSLPVSEYPLLMQFFVYDLPGCMEPAEYVRGIRVRGQLTFRFGPSPADVLARVGAKEIRTVQDYAPGAFARMTAKVAYGTAVAVKSIDPLKGRPRVVESIRGAEDEVGRWVGTTAQPRSIMSDVLHRVTIQVDRESGLLVGYVQLSETAPNEDRYTAGRLVR